MNSVKHYVIALYIRLSVEDSRTESLSIENQKRVLHSFVDSMEDVGNPEVLEFIDNGFSGTNFERPAVQELLDLVREGKINCILVKDFTRFGRNSLEVGYFMERVFPLYGIRFISVNDAFDSNKLHGDTGGVNVAFQYLIAEFYSRDLSMKSKSAQYVRFRRGEYQSKNCPYGYRKGANGRMEPNEETAPNVKLIFELARDGYKVGEIVRILFERGIPTPGEYKAVHGFKGHDVSRCCHIWSKSVISTLLHDERYTGCYIIGKREVIAIGSHKTRMKDESKWIKIPDHHPAIISKEVFDQVQSMRQQVTFGKRKFAEYPLRHKVFCGCCLHAMQRTKAKHPHFCCRYTAVNRDAACYGLRISESDLERTIYETMAKQAQIILNLDDLSHAKPEDIQSEKQSDCRKRIDALLDQKCALYEQLSKQVITVADYQAKKHEINRELDGLNRIQAILTAEAVQSQASRQAKTARQRAAHEIVHSHGLTAGLSDTLIDRVYIYPNNRVEIIWKLKDFCTEEASRIE